MAVTITLAHVLGGAVCAAVAVVLVLIILPRAIERALASMWA